MPILDDTLPYLLSLLSPPSAGLPAHPFSPYPPTTMTYTDWEEVANPATEIILSLAEHRKAQITSWEDGRVGKELIGLLIGRLVVGLEDQGVECKEWLEATNVCHISRGGTDTDGVSSWMRKMRIILLSLRKLSIGWR